MPPITIRFSKMGILMGKPNPYNTHTSSIFPPFEWPKTTKFVSLFNQILQSRNSLSSYIVFLTAKRCFFFIFLINSITALQGMFRVSQLFPCVIEHVCVVCIPSIYIILPAITASTV